MKILVTGGAGFIGSNLVQRLLNQGNDVLVIDNLSGGQAFFLDRFKSSPNFKFEKIDIRETSTLIEALDPNIEMIYHLAANADIARGVIDPTLDFEHSIVSTFSLLQAMRHHGLSKLLYTSGSGVYGDRGEHLFTETEGPLRPVSMYGASKLSAEGLISAFAHLYEMQAWVFRPANIIGPNATHGVVYDFFLRLREEPNKLHILGDGQQTKSYLYLEDVLDAFMLVQQKTNERVNFFNLASTSYISVTDIAKVVTKEMGLDFNRMDITYAGGKAGWKGDVPVIKLDNAYIEQLGWSAQNDSKTAVIKTVQHLINDTRFTKKPSNTREIFNATNT